LRSRLPGLFVVATASEAWAHCAGWSRSVADRHACCRGGQLASESRATACRAMSEQADDTAPVEARVAVTPLQVARHVSAAFMALAPPADGSVLIAVDPSRAPHPIPLTSDTSRS
jgi:hypothetical protein